MEYNKGLALAHLGNYTGAIEYYDKALAIDPNDVDALNNKGLALDNLGNSAEATLYYDKTLAINPNDTYALDGKGVGNLGNNIEFKNIHGCDDIKDIVKRALDAEDNSNFLV